MTDIISQEVNFDIRERLVDGTYKIKYPTTKAEQIIDLNEVDITNVNLAGTRLSASAVGSFTLPLGKVPAKYIKIYGGNFTFYCDKTKYYILVSTTAQKDMPKYFSYGLEEVVSDTSKVAEYMFTVNGSVVITKVTLSGANLIFSLKNTVASYRDITLIGSLEVL